MDTPRVAHYELVEKLGEGGMGVVYRATDTRLGRSVALKFIKAQFSQRFEREARAIAALNHPHIATLYDVGEHEGAPYLAMEFVEGAPLKGPYSAKETIEFGIQVADALAAAHRAGIVHRDLKPANILTTAKGSVKVLDFGLAKLTEQSGDGAPALTQTAAIAGTPGYIAPEQLNGKPADARGDVFAFGCVLYELIGGRRAFPGDTMAAAVTATLMTEPKPIDGAPRELAKLIRRCMRKDPERRPQHMDDVRVALEDIKEEPLGGDAAESVAPHAVLPIWPAAVCVLAGIAIGASAMFWFAHSRPVAKPLTFTMLTHDSGLTDSPVISRDGKLVAYASDRAGGDVQDIWVQQTSGGGVIRLTDGSDNFGFPTFSADGSLVAYGSSRGAIYVTSSLGGEPRRLAEGAEYPSLSPDGKWIAVRIRGRSRIGAIEVSTGAVFEAPLKDAATRADIFMYSYRGVWSPDSRRLLLRAAPAASIFSAAMAGYWLIDFDPTAPERSLQTGKRADVAALTIWGGAPQINDWVGDQVYFQFNQGDSGQLATARISLNGPRLGSPRLLAGGAVRASDATAALDGTIAFSSGIGSTDLWRLPVDANGVVRKGELQPLRKGRARDFYPYVSTHAHLLAFCPSPREVWTKDLASGREGLLAATAEDVQLPIVSADGLRVVYQTVRGSHVTFWMIPASGGAPKKIYEGDGRIHLDSWCPNGECILFEHFGTHKVIDRLELASGRTRQIAEHPEADLYQGIFTPDMRWLLVSLQRGGNNRLALIPMRGGAAAPLAEWVIVTPGPQDIKGRLSPDGKTVYYLTASGAAPALMAQPIDLQTGKPKGQPIELLTFASARRSPLEVGISQSELTVNEDSLIFNQALEFLHFRGRAVMIGFVSGHGFSRAESSQKGIGLQPLKMARPVRNASPESILGSARTFFATTKTIQGCALLQSERNAALMIDVLRSYVAAKKFWIHDFVIMPDHLHVLLTVGRDLAIEKAMQFIKGGFSYRLKRESGYLGEVWQPGFSETRVTDRQSFLQHREYIATNPVRAGLTESPEKYPYCFRYLATQKQQGLKPKD